MVKDQLQSAFIMEDDADWDVTLRHQLPEIAKGMQYVGKQSGTPHSPYGDGWDMLWIGHCGASNKQDSDEVDQPYYVVDNDPTVPARQEDRRGPAPNLSPESIGYTNTTRVLYKLNYARCLFGYALSLRGAYRVLSVQSLDQNSHSVDRAYSRMCSGHVLACYTVSPPIFGSKKPAGDGTRDSDRVAIGGLVRDKAETLDIKFPVLHNYWSLVTGEKKVQSQFSDGEIGEVDLSTFKYPKGRAVKVQPDQFTIA